MEDIESELAELERRFNNEPPFEFEIKKSDKLVKLELTLDIEKKINKLLPKSKTIIKR